jgi:predicted DNA-binding transcriptional regulator YafY
VEDQIINAIDYRRVLTFTYNGQPRRVNPHALIRSSRTQANILHAYQSDNGGWRNFWVHAIEDLAVLRETFEDAQPDFNPAHFRHVIYSL